MRVNGGGGKAREPSGRANLQRDAQIVLKMRDDAEQIAGGGVSRRSEHPHQTFGRRARRRRQSVEAEGYDRRREIPAFRRKDRVLV